MQTQVMLDRSPHRLFVVLYVCDTFGLDEDVGSLGYGLNETDCVNLSSRHVSK